MYNKYLQKRYKHRNKQQQGKMGLKVKNSSLESMWLSAKFRSQAEKVQSDLAESLAIIKGA